MITPSLPCFTTAILFAIGCGSPNENSAIHDARPSSAPHRRFAAIEWHEIARIGGAIDDTSLQMPARPLATESGIYILDMYEHAVLRFDYEGKLLTRFGRTGAGPGEFRIVRDLDVDSSGKIWVLDPGNARITILDSTLTHPIYVSLTGLGQNFDDFAPLDGATAVLVGDAQELPIIRIDTSGRQLDAQPFPDPLAQGLHSLAIQGTTVSARDGLRWMMAYQVSDGAFVMEKTEMRGRRIWYPEAVPAPQLVTRRQRAGMRLSISTRLKQPVHAAQSVAMQDTLLYILFGGTTAHANQIIDVYNTNDGTYVNSLLLPLALTEFSVWNQKFVGLFEQPYPGLVVLQASPSNDDGPRPRSFIRMKESGKHARNEVSQ